MGRAHLRDRLELVSTILAIVTCLLVLGLVGMRFMGARPSIDDLPPVMPVGERVVSPPNVGLRSNGFTVFIGLSTSCRYCAESMPAFRDLDAFIARVGDDRLRVSAVGSETEEVLGDYLRGNKINNFLVAQVGQDSSLAPAVRRVPSLVVVDSTGSVVASWPGVMSKKRMNDVVGLLSENAVR